MEKNIDSKYENKNKKSTYSIGEIIFNGRYKLLEMIGEGGMAQVFLATCLKDNSKVAIKINFNNFTDKIKYESYAKNFKAEVENIAKLNANNNVISLQDWDIQEGKPWIIVLEYADNGNLANLLKTYSVFTVKEIQCYFLQILNGLADAHKNGVIHRDLKPENVFLTANGTVKLGDFGISLLENDIKEAKRIKGTPKYMPPELHAGSIATFKSDIYMLGIMMYNFATGVAPFTSFKKEKEGQNETFQKHLNEYPIDPIDLNPKISIKLSNLIMNMIEKSPHDRPTALEVIERLKDPNIFEYEKPYMYKGRKKFDGLHNDEKIYNKKRLAKRVKQINDSIPSIFNFKILTWYCSIGIMFFAVVCVCLFFKVMNI